MNEILRLFLWQTFIKQWLKKLGDSHCCIEWVECTLLLSTYITILPIGHCCNSVMDVLNLSSMINDSIQKTFLNGNGVSAAASYFYKDIIL